MLDNKYLKYFLSFHQFIGGALGLVYILSFGINLASLVPIACFLYSMLCGYLYFRSSKAAQNLSIINYLFQFPGLVSIDNTSFNYNLFVSPSFGYSFDTDLFHLEFELVSFVYFPYGYNDAFYFNLLAALILLIFFFGSSKSEKPDSKLDHTSMLID